MSCQHVLDVGNTLIPILTTICPAKFNEISNEIVCIRDMEVNYVMVIDWSQGIMAVN